MQKFKTIREAMTMSPYAIGMAQAKKMYGYGSGPATDLPKKVIKKAHDIAKRVKANESFEDLVAESVDLTDKQDTDKGVTYKGMGTDVVNKKKKLNPTTPLTMKDRQVKDYMEEVEGLDENKTFNTDSGTAKISDTHVHFDNSGYTQKFSHPEIHKMIKGGKVRGFYKDKEYSTSDTHVFTNNEEDHYLPAKAVKHIKESYLDELSKKTLGSYVNRSANQAIIKSLANPKDDSDDMKTIDKREKGIRLATSKLAKEDIEQVDELSKKTLHSYVNKAAFDVGSNAHAVASAGSNVGKIIKPLDQLNKRLRGIDKAAGKMAKEEVEEIDELSKATLGSYVKKAHRQAVDLQRKQTNYERIANDDDEDPRAQKVYTHMANKADVKRATRTIGLQKAVAKLTKEEVLDEISKKTLGSYIKGAANDMTNREVRIDRAFQKDPSGPRDVKQAFDKQKKRYVGIDKAISKLTKEDIEEIDELSRNTMSSYVSKASDASKYKGMSTSKVDKRYSGVAQASKKLDKMNQSASNMANEAKEEMPTGIKIYHKNKDTGKEGYAIQFTVKNAQAHIKDLKKAGHAVTGKALMYGAKEGPRKAMAEEKLDELKKSTYGDYINKASRSLRASASIRKDFERDADQDVNRAYKKGTEPEEKERHLKNYEVNKGLAADFAKDSEKRLAGISRATKKLTK